MSRRHLGLLLLPVVAGVLLSLLTAPAWLALPIAAVAYLWAPGRIAVGARFRDDPLLRIVCSVATCLVLLVVGGLVLHVSGLRLSVRAWAGWNATVTAAAVAVALATPVDEAQHAHNGGLLRTIWQQRPELLPWVATAVALLAVAGVVSVRSAGLADDRSRTTSLFVSAVTRNRLDVHVRNAATGGSTEFELTALIGPELGEAEVGRPRVRATRRLAPGQDWVLHVDLGQLIDSALVTKAPPSGPVVPQEVTVLWRLQGAGQQRAVVVHALRGRPGAPVTLLGLA